MPRPAAHLSRVLAWLVAGACATHAGEVTQFWAPAADQSKLTAGAALMTDYIYRGISYSAHQPSVGTYVDAQYGWLYAYTNFNSVKFSTSPAVEVTMATGIRPTLGPFDFDSARPITTILASSDPICRITGRRTRPSPTS